ncbi:MAG: LLM class flavin-dependent oxidoreductase [Chloroflexi bacterium]|nr:LLM class flavin-dependent oxidoreductase [Chloroflexota bacterium]
MWRIANKKISLGVGFIPSLSYSALLSMIELMENEGYEQIWCGNEKHYRDMWVTMGLVSANTKNLEVGTFIAEPYSYHPSLIAAAIATVFEATNGRANLLLGSGGFGFRNLGINRVKPLLALEESVHLIRQLLAGEIVSLTGKVIYAKDIQLLFDSNPDIPIYIASRGKLIQQMAGRVADGAMLATHATPNGLHESQKSVITGCTQSGRDINDIKIFARIDVCIDQNNELARSTVKPMIAGMILASYPDQTFITQAGLQLSSEFETILNNTSFNEVYSLANELVSDEFVDAFTWAGAPGNVANKVAAVIDAGFTNICIVPHAPPGISITKIIKDFTTEIMPRVRALL